MHAEEHSKHSRRLTGSIGIPWGLAGDRQGEFLRVPQTPAHAGGFCRPATRVPEPRTARPAPIWLAALLATPCQAVANGEDRAILWDCASGRAMYTNSSAEIELIEPLGVELRAGDTLAVSWMPGETAYTLEVLNQSRNAAA